MIKYRKFNTPFFYATQIINLFVIQGSQQSMRKWRDIRSVNVEILIKGIETLLSQI